MLSYAVSWLQCVYPAVAATGIFQENEVTTMTDDALVACVTRRSAAVEMLTLSNMYHLIVMGILSDT